MKRWLKHKKHIGGVVIGLLAAYLLVQQLAAIPVAWAQVGVVVTLQLRDSKGNGVARTEITLLRTPENEAVNHCVTDETGRCQVALDRGIYAVHIAEAELSDLNRLAVAEGGLGDLGITVGSEAIGYSFVIAADGYLYFDAAPEAVVPEPIIPTEAMVNDHWQGLPEPTVAMATPEATTPEATAAALAVHLVASATPEVEMDSITASENTENRLVASLGSRNLERLLGLLVLGSGLGLGWATLQNRRQRKEVADGRAAQ